MIILILYRKLSTPYGFVQKSIFNKKQHTISMIILSAEHQKNLFFIHICDQNKMEANLNHTRECTQAYHSTTTWFYL